jgi:hypothetical protein
MFHLSARLLAPSWYRCDRATWRTKADFHMPVHALGLYESSYAVGYSCRHFANACLPANQQLPAVNSISIMCGAGLDPLCSGSGCSTAHGPGQRGCSQMCTFGWTSYTAGPPSHQRAPQRARRVRSRQRKTLTYAFQEAGFLVLGENPSITTFFGPPTVDPLLYQ